MSVALARGASGNERNPAPLNGDGAIELLAREMTAELIGIRAAATREAAAANAPITKSLVAKGISFGQITVQADGRVDPTKIQGVDWDLVIRPLSAKGSAVSLRQLAVISFTLHFGMTPDERFPNDPDVDRDGVKNEVSRGDVTAICVFMASLGVPGRRIPKHPVRRAAAARGKALFAQVGCASCHVPSLTLDSTIFTEPNPYNAGGMLRLRDVSRPFAFDLAKEGPGPHIETAGGKGIVRLYSDLKRHDLTDADTTWFANETQPQGSLLGEAPASAFTVPGQGRPTRQFLTAKLWHVASTSPWGHRGDLTTMTEAINVHGGEARAARDAFRALSQDDRNRIIEFLKTLQILPPGANRVCEEEKTPC